jgi:hypothetical protein
MLNISRLSEKLRSFSGRSPAPDPSGRTETFDDYLRRVIFPKDRYELRRVIFPSDAHDLVQGEPESQEQEDTLPAGPPLYTFRCHETGQEFMVDANFREAIFYQDKVEWCKPNRLKRYKEASQAGKPVFLALGLGQKGSPPEAVYLVPASQTTYSGLSHGSLGSYAFPPDQPVAPDYLWQLGQR